MWQFTENIVYICKNNDLSAMKLVFIILSVISLIILAAAIVIMLGRGDDLIAGYNIASNKSRDMYRIKRLRIIVGILLTLIAAALPVMAFLLIMGYAGVVLTAFPALAFVLVAVTFTAAHFWAKKRDKE